MFHWVRVLPFNGSVYVMVITGRSVSVTTVTMRAGWLDPQTAASKFFFSRLKSFSLCQGGCMRHTRPRQGRGVWRCLGLFSSFSVTFVICRYFLSHFPFCPTPCHHFLRSFPLPPIFSLKLGSVLMPHLVAAGCFAANCDGLRGGLLHW